MRQVISIFDINKTGFVSRSEFAMIIKNLETGLSQEQSRLLMAFFDDKNTGTIPVVEFVKGLQEIINHQGGGGVYAFMQVQPILHKIINELAIDSDKFFDELAELNESYLEKEQREQEKKIKPSRGQIIGLSKSLLYKHLTKYGVQLNEDEKTLLNTVFGMKDDLGKFDYEKLDIAFEGVQQQLYAKESVYTVEWERRVFKKIGEFLRKHNITIHKCFDLIDEDNSQTVSKPDFKKALLRFNLDIQDKEINVFIDKVFETGSQYITQAQFIKKFWSAYTYENVFQDEEDEDQDKSLRRPIGGLSEKQKNFKMFRAI